MFHKLRIMLLACSCYLPLAAELNIGENLLADQQIQKIYQELSPQYQELLEDSIQKIVQIGRDFQEELKNLSHSYPVLSEFNDFLTENNVVLSLQISTDILFLNDDERLLLVLHKLKDAFEEIRFKEFYNSLIADKQQEIEAFFDELAQLLMNGWERLTTSEANNSELFDAISDLLENQPVDVKISIKFV
jgi:hypothetical protein